MQRECTVKQRDKLLCTEKSYSDIQKRPDTKNLAKKTYCKIQKDIL